MPKTTIRPEIAAFKPYEAGMSMDELRERYGVSRIIKMASNENPLGTSPVAARALAEAAPLAYRYAAAGTPKLRRAIAEHLGVDPARIVCGNGSDEIIDLLVRVKCRPGLDNIAAFSPCFAMYKLQADFAGVEFRQAPMGEDLEFDFDGLVNIADSSTALCFVTSPDNPSGRTATAGELETLARTLPAQCMLVVDEAYIEFTGDEAAHSLLPRLDEFENLIITRTFSKCYGLAGLRLGYGIMPPWLADLLQRVKQPFSVNIMAETGVLAALKDPHFIEQTVRTVAQGREYLTNELEALGCSVLPSKANFLLIRLPEDRMKTADMVFEELLERGIIIRPLTSYRMPDALRVSVGNTEENREFMRALREILA